MTEHSTRFTPFAQEHWQSRWERSVEFNVADSAVRCVALGELLDDRSLDALRSMELYYPQINGTVLLRERIAAMYEGVTPDHILVTVGAAEANQLLCQTLLTPDDHVVVIEPGYRQVRGLAENLGCAVTVVELDEQAGWDLAVEDIRQAMRPSTKLVYVVNPNNPTGAILSESQMSSLVDAVTSHGAWLLCDEVYRGTEHLGPETPTFAGRHPRVLVVSSLSKAYGLCGLRVGWIVGEAAVVEECWRRHEYAVISAAGPSMFIAELALEPDRRRALLARQRVYLHEGRDRIERWASESQGLVSCQPLRSTALALVRYHFEMSSVEVADAIREKCSVLVIPGAFMGAERHLRITHALGADYLDEALERMTHVLGELSGSDRAG